ncbi:ArsI/CadI family heavy metal resistance metalloenzyme [Alkalicoccobacillus porphyridii]|uniref:Glyoxalase/bleomycin resistance/dioxygenase family protein n=1 Tax=Alkalicoccobacillus porphyridii TaxID=2597270 RepID=A0A553ZWP5_9BACI|nr:ArsI/CadI family heavy metal resistance metalloenzyme [Alkalicoccobacillus porphyridii]TSB45880.1 glyoxalase/bleomycin resistance/dioxygenase family protein [Alkalicoccobacillus porphyridii]
MVYVHIGMNVKNIKESKEFYERFLGVKPVKEKQNYVKFLTEKPALNLTLQEEENYEGNQINHLGVQIESKDDVLYHKKRLEKEGFFAREEMDVNCCYALQDKFWVTDPNGIEWEYFYTKEDID